MFFGAVSVVGQHFTFIRYQHGTHRHFAACGGGLGFFQRYLHEIIHLDPTLSFPYIARYDRE